MVGSKERRQQARRDGSMQGETVACKERWWQARRDGSRQGEMAGGNVKVALFQIYLAPVIPEVCKGEETQCYGCFSIFLRTTMKPSEWVKKMASTILSSNCCNVPESLDDSALLLMQILEESL